MVAETLGVVEGSFAWLGCIKEGSWWGWEGGWEGGWRRGMG